MKNKVALIDFPEKIETDVETYRYYHLYFLKSPINDFILSTFQAIIVYDPMKETDISSLNFYNKIHLISEDGLTRLKQETTYTLDQLVGRKHLVNPRQFEVLEGSIVRSKLQPTLGAGVVKKVYPDDTVQIFFSQAKKQQLPENIKCHKSTLRVITHIKELAYNEKNKSVR